MMYIKDACKVEPPKQMRVSNGKGRQAREALLALADGESVVCAKAGTATLRFEMHRLNVLNGRSGNKARYMSRAHGDGIRVWRIDEKGGDHGCT